MNPEVLVCNCGSSSLKVDVFRVAGATDEFIPVANATAERLGSDDSGLRLKIHSRETSAPEADTETRLPAPGLNHQTALTTITERFAAAGVFAPENRLGVGHRVVHGGPYVSAPVLLNAETIQIIERCSEFAPLHNPVNLIGIRECARLFGPALPQVGVFDTAFHATLPAEAYTYALPHALVEKYALRRFGFHGTSHEYCAEVLRQKLPKTKAAKMITLHLGNGASICAIRDGRSLDTSMGFTPLEGLVMGTRSGDLDPAIVGLLLEKEGLTLPDLDALLNKKSGLKGICDQSDMRDILTTIQDTNVNDAARTSARLALEVFCYRAKKYVGAYAAALGGVDAIAFTAGIGENSPDVRAKILTDMQYAGVMIDPEKNLAPPADGEISASNSAVRVFVIPADEELAIARKTRRLLASCLD